MTEKVLQLAKAQIVEILRVKCTDLQFSDIEILSSRIVNTIDWNNSALMHKSLIWIVNSYLQNHVL